MRIEDLLFLFLFFSFDFYNLRAVVIAAHRAYPVSQFGLLALGARQKVEGF